MSISTAGLFIRDSNTVFLADFNGNLTDHVSGVNGQVTGGIFAASPFGKSIQFDSALFPKGFYSTFFPKAVVRFPNSPSISLSSGSLEALVNVQRISPGFMHIVDKSWLYGLTVYNGMVAVDFGKTWWYSKYAIPTGKWTYLCGSFDGKTIKLYANGSLVDAPAYFPSLGDDSWGLAIGNGYDDNFNIPFMGKIDEVRISKKARSEPEIRAWGRFSFI